MQTSKSFSDVRNEHSPRFDPASELYQINRNQLIWQPVSVELYAALEVALWAANTTQGLYDPTILTALEEAGYDRSFEQIDNRAPGQLDVADATTASTGLHRRQSDFQGVRLDAATRSIRREPEIRLDLGGMGKGWTVDRAADLLHRHGPFLLNAGGDLYAHGRPSLDAGWTVELEHPLAPTQWMARLQLANRALASSTVAKRRWRKDGRLQHHLIDPRTGRPAETDLVSVTVVASRTVLADIFAKVVLLLGSEAGLAYIEAVPDMDALVYTTAGQIRFSSGFTDLLEAVEPTGVVEVKRFETPSHKGLKVRRLCKMKAISSSFPCLSLHRGIFAAPFQISA